MNKRNRLIIAAVASLTIPAGFIAADGIQSISFDEAAEHMEENDLGSQIQNVKPEIDSDSQAYQSKFSDDLNEISDLQNKNSDFQQEKAAEMTAYTTLWNYWVAGESLQISEANLERAVDELELMQLKQEKGVASEMDVLQSEMNVTNANMSLETAQQGLTLSQYQVNQKLDQPLETAITLEDIPDAGVVPEDLYDVSTYEPIIRNHDSLATLKKQVAVYKDILSRVDNLSVLGGDDMRDQIDNLEDQIDKLDEQIEQLSQLREALPSEEDASESNDGGSGEVSKQSTTSETPQTKEEAQAQIDKLKEQRTQLYIQLDDAEDRYDDAKDDRNQAEEELEDYYKVELKNAEIRLQQQEEALQLLLNQYAEQLKTLDTQIKSYQSNVEKAEKLYEKTEALLNNGMITPSKLEESRLNIQNQKLNLKQSKKDYAVKKKELSLFLDGYMPQGG